MSELGHNEWTWREIEEHIVDGHQLAIEVNRQEIVYAQSHDQLLRFHQDLHDPELWDGVWGEGDPGHEHEGFRS